MPLYRPAMNERFRHSCAYVLVLSILLHSFAADCCPEFLRDTSSNAEDGNYVVEERQVKSDPAIERIFRGPTDGKSDPTDTTAAKRSPARGGEIDTRARTKRENAARRGVGKNSNEVKRAASRPGRASSRNGRSSGDLAKLPDKDYEVAVDQERSEFADAAEDESRNRDAKYRGGGEYRVGDDSERFIEQEERSSLYDDFEAKDVVKRGISGAEDYEEMDDDGVGSLGDTAAFDDGETSDEEGGKRKTRGDVRVKREHDASKDAERADLAGKGATRLADPSAKRDTANEEESKAAGKAAKEASERDERQAKRNAAEKPETDVSKATMIADASKPALAPNDKAETDDNESAKFQARADSPATIGGDGKVQEVGPSGSERAVASDAIEGVPKGLAKPDETRMAELSNPDPAKLEVPVSVPENQPPDDGSKNEAAVGEQPDGGYEKRVEEQIQRRIDSIKEEIKREIAENQRVKEIEENNAKFDELRDQEDDDDEEGSAAALSSSSLEADASSEKRDEPSKRSARSTGSGQPRVDPRTRLVERKKRQGETAKEKVADEPDSSRRKVRLAPARKRSAAGLRELPKKREIPRRIYLVKRDRDAAKRKRKRRSKNPMPIREQRAVKPEENLPADLAPDSSLTGGPGPGGKSGVAGASLSDERSGSVASLTADEEETGPLATEYGDAFGGLHGEPGVALARFKRIKRVLRPQASKT